MDLTVIPFLEKLLELARITLILSLDLKLMCVEMSLLITSAALGSV
jgi:hypothetical protein